MIGNVLVASIYNNVDETLPILTRLADYCLDYISRQRIRCLRHVRDLLRHLHDRGGCDLRVVPESIPDTPPVADYGLGEWHFLVVVSNESTRRHLVYHYASCSPWKYFAPLEIW